MVNLNEYVGNEIEDFKSECYHNVSLTFRFRIRIKRLIFPIVPNINKLMIKECYEKFK